MTSIVWRTDAHIADTAPQSRKDDWKETILAKLEQVGEIARQEQAALVLDGGDLFHVKTPSRTAHVTNQRLVQLHQAYPCLTASNIGNHDVKYGDMRFLEESPLGVLFEAGVFQRCYDEWELYLTEDSKKVFPYNRKRDTWLVGDPFVEDRKGAPVVRVVGVPYHGTKYDLERLRGIRKGREDYLVLSAHCLASATGGTMFEREDIIRYADLLGLAPDVFCFGHWHKNQGVTEISAGKYVVNIGSMSRGSLSEDEVGRVPEVAVLSFGPSGIQIRQVPLKVEAASEVFDIESRVRQESRRMSVGAFIESLKETLLTKEVGSLSEDIRTMPGIPDVVRERALQILEGTSGD